MNFAKEGAAINFGQGKKKGFVSFMNPRALVCGLTFAP